MMSMLRCRMYVACIVSTIYLVYSLYVLHLCLCYSKHYVQLWYRSGPYSTEIKPLRFPDGKCQNASQCTLSEFEK